MVGQTPVVPKVSTLEPGGSLSCDLGRRAGVLGVGVLRTGTSCSLRSGGRAQTAPGRTRGRVSLGLALEVTARGPPPELPWFQGTGAVRPRGPLPAPDWDGSRSRIL